MSRRQLRTAVVVAVAGACLGASAPASAAFGCDSGATGWGTYRSCIRSTTSSDGRVTVRAGIETNSHYPRVNGFPIRLTASLLSCHGSPRWPRLEGCNEITDPRIVEGSRKGYYSVSTPPVRAAKGHHYAFLGYTSVWGTVLGPELAL